MTRLNRLLSCLAGCLVATLVGLLAMLKFDAPVFALLSAAVFPTFAVWIAGLIDRKQLAKIAAYAAVGWALTFMLQPISGQSSTSRARRVAESPLVGHEWHVPASCVSTLLALIGTGFAPVIRVDPSSGDRNAA